MISQRILFMPPSFDVYNRNGAEMCHRVGCRKHTKLTRKYNGLFCKAHVTELDGIREGLRIAKKTNDLAEEDVYRQLEIECRKLHDKGHMYWKLKLERRLEHDEDDVTD